MEGRRKEEVGACGRVGYPQRWWGCAGKKKKIKTAKGMSMSPPSGGLQKLFGATGGGRRLK